MIFVLIHLDQSLHTPMYFFLSHLAIIDISYASNNVPKMLANLVTQNRAISFVSCIMQTFLYLVLAATECLILMAMSYDQYVAICHPLHYTVIMSWTLCTVLATTSWLCAFDLALINVLLLLRLPFCRSHEVNHLFCELLSVLRLGCGDTWLNKVAIFAASIFVLVGPLCLMLVSYIHILWAILKIPSGQGRKKAFSTCSSRLCVVRLYFGIAMVVYTVPDSSQREEKENILSLFHSLFNPMLNPLIYSLRNAQVKDALCRVLQVR
ncbi:olfactory receptor 2A2-like [Sturnira hondurensis]|uniref:olfactory receptor 2A2-like n=1 Tax=Sturnira hondurensis TaxID=192404 RepID=UPI00187B0BAB|nr:olfactory receptor 2A2-like [Sturnira hondurensis]